MDEPGYLPAAMRTLVACLMVYVVFAVGTDFGQFARVRERSPAPCCCGPRGDARGCRCTGPCCSHAAAPRDDRSQPGFDDHCGVRHAAPALATSLQPGTPAAVRLPRPVPEPVRRRVAHEPAAPRPDRAPPEPPPRAPAG